MTTYWGIHNGDKSIEPVDDGGVRIGFDETSDLRNLPHTREAVKEEVRRHYPGASESTRNAHAGVLYRFAWEMEVGDIVVSPRTRDRTLRIGCVSGPYEVREAASNYTHFRPVEWLIPSVSRDELSLPAQDQISSALTLSKLTVSTDEIDYLLSQPSTTLSDTRFTWVPFHEELIDKILAYRDDRPELIRKVLNVGERTGNTNRFKYLAYENNEKGNRVPLTDIDPLTAMAPFNRGISEQARLEIARGFKDEFDIHADAPQDFLGIPIVNNLKSWFIPYTYKRSGSEVDDMWNVVEAAVAYAADKSPDTSAQLAESFDQAPFSQTRMLTMGLYWIRPRTFLAYDNRNVAYLRQEMPDLADGVALQAKITGDEFMTNTECVSDKLSRRTETPTTPYELSLDAWLMSETTTPEPATERPEDPVSDTDPYTTDSIIEAGSFINQAELDRYVEILKNKKNLILQGPPGTGKTWLSKRLGWALAGDRSDEHVTVMQFHPSMSYEDFVRGMRPNSDGRLELLDGPFLQFCEKARQDPQNNHVMVIEEINRGNPAQIFGELLTLLEKSKRNTHSAMRLSYARSNDERFFIPSNVFVIGTMNVADRSLAFVDLALRRRFAFIELEPQLNDTWLDYVTGKDYDRDMMERIGVAVRGLNDVIDNDPNLGRQFRIGHSYFVPSSSGGGNPSEHTRAWLVNVIETELRPLLDEYWFDQPQRVEDETANLFGVL